jgi:hypothetical protein
MAADQGIALAAAFGDPVEMDPVVSPRSGVLLAPWT